MTPIYLSAKSARACQEQIAGAFPRSGYLAVAVAVLLSGALDHSFAVEIPRALPLGQLPKDHRLQPQKDLDGYFPFKPSTTREEWDQRARQLRRQIQVAVGLWPAPEKTPLSPVIHGKINRGDYTVEKVYFESAPGFFVTGNLYRPTRGGGPRPGVLCPHGHWDNGRFMDYGPDRVRQEIVQGAERFEEGGRSVLQARCVQLARMGCIVFHYDMIGYADSQQISFDIAHKFAKQRPEMNSTESWGLFSPQAETHLQSIMGLQTLNSIRSLDFLLGLPDIDPKRIAVTGASGGGTQTFILCALDSRPALSFPAVMVSTAMQGGCTCENASLLRVETGNVEFAALFAPKPLGMTAANDWTKEMPTKGFPELKRHYALMGAPDKVMLKPLIHFEHNYNYVSRAAMYSWVNQQFKLGLPEPIVEQDYKRLSREEMSVWDEQHPQPESGPEFERKLLRWLTEDSNRHLQETVGSADKYREIVGSAIDVLIGRKLADAGSVVWESSRETERDGYSLSVGLARNMTHGEEVPVLFLQPKQTNGHVVVWITETGKAGLLDDAGSARPEIRKLLDSGATVVGVDLLYQGEFLKDGKPLARTPRVKNPRESAAYTFGYNRAVFAQRVHDILSVVALLRNQLPRPRIALAALDSTGPLVAAARAQARDAVDRTAVETRGFRFGHVLRLDDPDFLPGGAKYGDLPGMLALGAPGKLWVSGEGEQLPEILRSAYGASGAPDRLAVAPNGGVEAAVVWLTQK